MKRFWGALYLWALLAAGALLFLYSLSELRNPNTWYFTILLTFTAVLSDFIPALNLRELTVTLTNMLVMFSIVALGYNVAVTVAGFDIVTLGLIGTISGFMMGVNIGQTTLTALLTGLAWMGLSAHLPLIISALLSILVYLAASAVLTGPIVSIRLSISLRAAVFTMWSNMDFTLSLVSMLTIGAIAGLLYRSYGYASLLLIALMYLFIRYMLKRRVIDSHIIQEYAQEVKRRYNASITSLAHAIDARDSYTFGHSLRVAALSKRLTLKMDAGLNPEEVYFGGLLHDIGKIAIPDSILLKPGMLEASELVTMMSHPILGEQILRDSGVSGNILSVVRWHHEWVAGGGYPDNKSGDDIPFVARLVSVADAFDAMVSNRPYRRGCSVEDALERLKAFAGRQFDRRVVDAITQVIELMTEEEMLAIGYTNEPVQEVLPIVDLPGSDLTLAERLDASRKIIEWETAAIERYALAAPKGGSALFWQSRYGHLPSMFPGSSNGKYPAANAHADFALPSVAAGWEED